MKKRSGFTLLELLIVIGILASLVAISMPFYKDYVNQANLTRARSEMDTFSNALTQYDQLEIEMFDKSNDLTKLIGKYLQDFRKVTGQKVPDDPWGNSYGIYPERGIILSGGPNGENESGGVIDGTDTGSKGVLVAQGDDLMHRWKSPFYLTGMRYGGPTVCYFDFSRKLIRDSENEEKDDYNNMSVTGGGWQILDAHKQAVSIQEDPTIVKLTLTGTGSGSFKTGATYNWQVKDNGEIVAQDGAKFFDNNPANPEDAGSGASGTFRAG
ncbi:type IV pilin protein [Candidatus Riflebacteria bacterium]